VAGLLAIGQPYAAAVPLPKDDPFYAYTASTPLSAVAPGTVLKTRAVTFHLAGVTTPFAGTQLLYRTTGQRGQPTVTVTSVIQPAVAIFPQPRLISYQLAYDALDAKCDPSYFISGAFNLSGGTTAAEQLTLTGLLTGGYTVVTSDYEGEDLAWTAGGQSGMQTLDGIRAALRSPATGLPAATKVGVLGYSGGAIASEWATELAPHYAPDVDKHLVGTAIGGVYVYPAHNLTYVSGTPLWSGVMPGALTGVARGFGIDLNDYASPYGKKLVAYARDKCIPDLLGHYPGLTFAKLVKPQYAQFAKVRQFVELNNKLIMSTGGTPTVPLLMVQGAGGEADGTPGNKPGIGPGDGVMIAGDVRSLARTYCRRGLAVRYDENALEHLGATAPFFAAAIPWLGDRFAGTPAPNTCAKIKAGNSLAPLPLPAARIANTAPGTADANASASPRAAAPDSTLARPADTGADSRRLLLWALLLVGLGGAVQWAGTAPRPGAAPERPLPKRPLPGRRRPLPYPRP